LIIKIIITYNFLYLSCRQSSGDGGIDLIGNYDGLLTLIQCKHYTNTIGVGEVRKFLGAITPWPKKTTFSIFVSSNESPDYNYNKGFSPDAIEFANNSQYNILLTNIQNLQTDIAGYKFKYLKESEEAEGIKEDLSKLNRRMRKLESRVEKKGDEIMNQISDKIRDEINYFKLQFFIIFFVVLIFSLLIIYIIKN
jgi:restriction endonuclease Mrr